MNVQNAVPEHACTQPLPPLVDSFPEHACTQPLPPLVDSWVNDGLLQTMQDVNKASFQFIFSLSTLYKRRLYTCSSMMPQIL